MRTAIAMAFFWPMRTTGRSPRVTPVVEEISLQHRIVLGEDRDDHGGIFGALTLMDGGGVGGNKRVKLAKSVGQGAVIVATCTLCGNDQHSFGGQGVATGDRRSHVRTDKVNEGLGPSGIPILST